MREASSGSEFRAWYKRRQTGLLVLCAAAIPVGLLMELPAVWILGIAGVAICCIQLRQLEKRRQVEGVRSPGVERDTGGDAAHIRGQR